MRTVTLFILMSTFFISASVTANAQSEIADTLKTEKLNEVVVEAQMQRTGATATTYYPDRNSKRTAQNAIDLLSRMAIPQINVNPVDGTIQTPSGEEVAIYIDMELATAEEKDALRPEDVKKVEYLMYPTDPRFNHNRYVINITLRHYDYGGYAKFSGTENLLAGSTSGLGYAKLSKGNMTYDLNVNDKYTDRRHTGEEMTQTYRFPLADGSIKEITRSNLLDGSRYINNLFGASFRAKYATDKTTISNSLVFSANNTPHRDNDGRILFTGSELKGGTYSNSSDVNYIYPRWAGNYFFDFGKEWKISAFPAIHYQHTVSKRLYVSNDTEIKTDATENALTGQLQLQLNKSFHKYHTIDVNLVGIYYRDKVKYTGNTIASPEFNQFAYGGILGYSFAKDNFYGQFLAGIAGESNKISGIRTSSLIPLFEINSQYAFSDKSSLSISGQYNVNATEAAEKTPDMIQENELMYKTGNPHLKNTHWGRIEMEYTWMPNNQFSLAPYFNWSGHFNHITPIYTPDGPDGTMLRSMINNGDFYDFNLGVSFSARLLDRSLVLSAVPEMWFEKLTGVYASHANYFRGRFSATYYLGNLYFQAYYRTPARGLIYNSLDELRLKGKSQYQLKIGWSNGKWNISANAVNIFRRSWMTNHTEFQSDYFDQYKTTYSADQHRFISLTATYTFGFGKKIRHNDEVTTDSQTNTAIMK